MNRLAEIERFYWLLLNLAGKAFGYLMLIGGIITAAAFLRDAVDGVVSVNGREYADWTAKLAAVAIPSIVAYLGFLLVKILPIYPASSRDSS